MRSHRTTLGPRFSEGARLVWVAMQERELTLADLQKLLRSGPGEELGIGSGTLVRLLYGDRGIGGWYQEQFAEVLQVPAIKWHEPPSVEFTPPGVSQDGETAAPPAA